MLDATGSQMAMIARGIDIMMLLWEMSSGMSGIDTKQHWRLEERSLGYVRRVF